MAPRKHHREVEPLGADEWVFYSEDVGTHIDSAYGPEHVFRKMEGLLASVGSTLAEPDETILELQDEAEVLREEDELPDDAWYDDATEILQSYTEPEYTWVWDAGDLILMPDEEVE